MAALLPIDLIADLHAATSVLSAQTLSAQPMLPSERNRGDLLPTPTGCRQSCQAKAEQGEGARFRDRLANRKAGRTVGGTAVE